MTWTINPDPVCGGISIIDENGRGVAIVIQRDPHPTLGQGVTLEEAERRARVMAAGEDLLEALEDAAAIINGVGGELPLVKSRLYAYSRIISKARGEA